jgi:hypothetical protein
MHFRTGMHIATFRRDSRLSARSAMSGASVAAMKGDENF